MKNLHYISQISYCIDCWIEIFLSVVSRLGRGPDPGEDSPLLPDGSAATAGCESISAPYALKRLKLEAENWIRMQNIRMGSIFFKMTCMR